MPGYFLDTSALAKLYHQETGSKYVEALFASPDSKLVISRLSLVEMESAVAIKVRMGELDETGREIARRRLHADVAQGRLKVGPVVEEAHYRRARSLLGRFGVERGLRTLDSLQLAIALDLRDAGLISVFVASDHRLCQVANACGFSTIDPSDPGMAVAIVP